VQEADLSVVADISPVRNDATTGIVLAAKH
jgi:hypothetical protein